MNRLPPLQSSALRFFNDLQTRGERLRPPKSYKTSLFVDRIVDRNFDLAAATSVNIFLRATREIDDWRLGHLHPFR